MWVAKTLHRSALVLAPSVKFLELTVAPLLFSPIIHYSFSAWPSVKLSCPAVCQCPGRLGQHSGHHSRRLCADERVPRWPAATLACRLVSAPRWSPGPRQSHQWPGHQWQPAVHRLRVSHSCPLPGSSKAFIVVVLSEQLNIQKNPLDTKIKLYRSKKASQRRKNNCVNHTGQQVQFLREIHFTKSKNISPAMASYNNNHHHNDNNIIKNRLNVCMNW